MRSLLARARHHPLLAAATAPLLLALISGCASQAPTPAAPSPSTGAPSMTRQSTTSLTSASTAASSPPASTAKTTSATIKSPSATTGAPTKPNPRARDITLHVVPTVPQPAVQVAAGSKITVYFPPNPMGIWTAPKSDAPSVLQVSASRAPSGMTVVITAVGTGTGHVTVNTTPSGDPRPPGTIRYLNWEVQVTVT